MRRALRHEIDRSAASRQILLEAMAVSALADAAKVAADRFWRAGSPLYLQLQHHSTYDRPPWPITPSAGRDGERALLLRLVGKHLHSTITRLYDRLRPPNHFCRDRHHPFSYAGAKNRIPEVIGRRRYSHPHVQRRCGRGRPSARKSYRREARTGRCSHPRQRSGRGRDRSPSQVGCGGCGRRLEVSGAHCCIRAMSEKPLICAVLCL